MKLPKRENLIVTNDEDPLDFYYYPLIGWFYRKRLADTLSLLEKQGFNKTLEIGFGSGILFSELIARTKELYGIEVHDKVSEVSKRMKAEGLYPILNKASVYSIPYPDGYFDCIIAVSTAEHLHELDKAWLEIKRVASPGAHIVLSFPVRNVLTDIFYSLFGFNPRELHPNSHNDIVCSAEKYFKLVTIKQFPKYLSKNWALYNACLFLRT